MMSLTDVLLVGQGVKYGTMDDFGFFSVFVSVFLLYMLQQI